MEIKKVVYENLTLKERFKTYLKAIKRNDEIEVERLNPEDRKSRIYLEELRNISFGHASYFLVFFYSWLSSWYIYDSAIEKRFIRANIMKVKEFENVLDEQHKILDNMCSMYEGIKLAYKELDLDFTEVIDAFFPNNRGLVDIFAVKKFGDFLEASLNKEVMETFKRITSKQLEEVFEEFYNK